MADRYTSKEVRDLQGNTERFIWDNKTNKRVSNERVQQSLRIPANLYTRKRIGGRNVLVSKETGEVVSQKEQRQLIDNNRQIRTAAKNKLRGDAYSSINRNIVRPVGAALSDFMKIGVWADGGVGKETVLGRKSRLAQEEQQSNLEDDRKEFKPDAAANLRIQQRMAAANNEVKNRDLSIQQSNQFPDLGSKQRLAFQGVGSETGEDGIANQFKGKSSFPTGIEKRYGEKINVPNSYGELKPGGDEFNPNSSLKITDATTPKLTPEEQIKQQTIKDLETMSTAASGKNSLRLSQAKLRLSQAGYDVNVNKQGFRNQLKDLTGE